MQQPASSSTAVAWARARRGRGGKILGARLFEIALAILHAVFKTGLCLIGFVKALSGTRR